MKLSKETKVVILAATMVLMVPGVCAITFVGVGMSVNNVQTQDLSKTEDPPPIVTLAEFERIREGMSRREVLAIVGVPGVSATPEGGDGDGKTSVTVWQNSDASHMNVTFENDRLVEKAQLYLK